MFEQLGPNWHRRFDKDCHPGQLEPVFQVFGDPVVSNEEFTKRGFRVERGESNNLRCDRCVLGNHIFNSVFMSFVQVSVLNPVPQRPSGDSYGVIENTGFASRGLVEQYLNRVNRVRRPDQGQLRVAKGGPVGVLV